MTDDLETGPPYPPIPPTGSNAIGRFQIGVPYYGQIGDIPPFNIWTTIISQYANSIILDQLIVNLNAYVDQTKNLNDFYDLMMNIDTAQGYGLDVWGRIVGIGRVLQVASVDYLQFAEQGAGGRGWNNGVWYSGENLSNNFRLSDKAYRTLIFAKALANICDGSIPSINQLLLNLFPHRGNCYVQILGPIPYFGWAEASHTNPSYIRGWGDAGLFHKGYFGFAEASASNDVLGWNQGPWFSLFYQTQNPVDNSLRGCWYSGQPIPHMAIAYVFEFPLTPVELTIVQSSGVLPTPVAVSASIITPTTP